MLESWNLGEPDSERGPVTPCYFFGLRRISKGFASCPRCRLSVNWLWPQVSLAFGYQRHVFMSLAAGVLASQYSDELHGLLACWVLAVWFSFCCVSLLMLF